MALRGNLRDFSITQLLNLVNLARKTGILVVEGPSEIAQVYFRDGKLAYAQMGQNTSGLAAILHGANRITSKQYKGIQQSAAHFSDKELGLLLINAGYLTQQDILTHLQIFSTDIVRRLFTWVEGYFHFENNLLPPDDRISVRVDLENLIIDGSRQLREWEHLQDEIPSLDMALRFSNRPGVNIRNINLSVEEWRVVSFINPRNTIKQIANAAKMNELEIRRIVYGLIQAGLVVLCRQEGGAQVRQVQSLPGEDREEKKSLVNRLITRIRSL
jgi:hypothetical protein